MRSQIFRQAEAAPRIVQIECRQAVSVGQPLCHFVTLPPQGEITCQEKLVQDGGKAASKAYAKP